MALTTFNEIEQRILENWEQLENSQYPDDVLHELADSETPIYYGDIVSEWNELSNDDSNRFGEIMVIKPETTIYELQQADLYLYYYDQLTTAYESIKEQKAVN